MLPKHGARGALLVLILALVLAACGGASAAPQLIGSYPQEPETGAGLPEYAPPARNLLVVYSASLELEARDVDAAADRAAQLAYDYGGYLAESQSWRRDGRKYTTLTLAVPVAYFEAVYAGLLELGTLISENVSGDLRPVGQYGDEWNTFTHITVSLRPAEGLVSMPRLTGSGWNPIRTFLQAFGFVAGILQVVVDGLIWVVVVAGPFGLVGWGVRGLARRWRRPRIF